MLEWPGPLDEARWRKAIERAAAAHPTMRARLRGVGRGCRWQVDETPVPVETLPTAGWHGAGPEGGPDLTHPLPPETGPVSRVLLLPGSPARVIVSAHHAVTDGRGLFGFCADLIASLAGEPIVGASAGPPIDAELARSVGARPEREPPLDAVAPTGAFSGAAGLTWRRVRAEGTRHAVVARAIVGVAHGARAFTEGPLRVGVPVDLRRHAPELRSGANLTGVLRLDVPADPQVAALRAVIDEGLAALRPASHALAADAVRGVPLWLMAWLGGRSGRAQLAAGRYAASATISSLGRQDWRIDDHPVRCIFIPPGAPAMPLFVGLCGDAAGVEVVGVAPCGLADGGRLDAVLSAISAALS